MYQYILLGTRLNNAGPITNAIGRQLLYAVIGVEVLVLASKQLFTMRDFKRIE
jgi:hypothetical protein